LFRDELPDVVLHLPITVGSNVFIGSDSIILPGVSIGDNSVVGAGSVVTKDVPTGTVVAGCPARVVKSVDEYKRGVLRKARLSSSAGPIANVAESAAQ
jgi:acetyltransferase-like isoleucine patch superfamily enzyme